MVIWVTGRSAAGKTTLCQAMVAALRRHLRHVVMLDGDVLREVFGNDLAYDEASRRKQIERLQHLARMLASQGQIVVVAALYSHPDLLAWNRANLPNYFEIYLDASLDLVRRRDPKALYVRAFAGEMKDVVGIDIPWHEPLYPDLKLDAAKEMSPETLALDVIRRIPDLARVAGLAA